MEKGKERVETLLKDEGVSDGSSVWGSLFDGVLGDRAKVMEESQLPQTGMPASIEHKLSSIFVEPFQLKVPQLFPPALPYSTPWHSARNTQHKRLHDLLYACQAAKVCAAAECWRMCPRQGFLVSCIALLGLCRWTG